MCLLLLGSTGAHKRNQWCNPPCLADVDLARLVDCEVAGVAAGTGLVELAASDCGNWAQATCNDWGVHSVPNIRVLTPWAYTASNAAVITSHSTTALLEALYPTLVTSCAHAAAPTSWLAEGW